MRGPYLPGLGSRFSSKRTGEPGKKKGEGTWTIGVTFRVHHSFALKGEPAKGENLGGAGRAKKAGVSYRLISTLERVSPGIIRGREKKDPVD